MTRCCIHTDGRMGHGRLVPTATAATATPAPSTATVAGSMSAAVSAVSATESAAAATVAKSGNLVKPLLSTKYVHIKSTTVYAPRRNWDSPPTPHSQASVPPPPCFWGEGNTRRRERGWESPNSDEGHTLWYSLYVRTLCFCPSIGTNGGSVAMDSGVRSIMRVK
jgi:hypothetical protein